MMILLQHGAIDDQIRIDLSADIVDAEDGNALTTKAGEQALGIGWKVDQNGVGALGLAEGGKVGHAAGGHPAHTGKPVLQTVSGTRQKQIGTGSDQIDESPHADGMPQSHGTSVEADQKLRHDAQLRPRMAAAAAMRRSS